MASETPKYGGKPIYYGSSRPAYPAYGGSSPMYYGAGRTYGGAYGGKCMTAGKTSDYHNVGGVEEQLQHAGCNNRKGVQNNFPQKGTVGHVEFFLLSG